MNIKQYLQHKFEYEEQKEINKHHISNMQSRLLKQLKKQKKHSLLQYRNPFILVAFAIILLLIGSITFFQNNNADKGRIIQAVSAQEVIRRAQQTLKESDRVYYKIHYGGKQYEKEVKGGVNIVEPQKGTYEFWYDFTNRNVRIEQPDYNGTNDGKVKRAFVQKKITDKKYLIYQFTADPRTKEGLFTQVYSPNDVLSHAEANQVGVGVNLPVNPKKRFEEILKKFSIENRVKLETITEGGKEYYKLTLTLPYDTKKEALVVTGYELLIDKNTYAPYKEIQLYENGKGVIETVYDEVSTDFENNIFDPIPPKGYILLKDPKLKVSENEPTLIKCNSNALNETLSNYDEVCSPGIYGVYTILKAEFTNGKSTIPFGHYPNGPEVTMGFDFNLYRSKQTFQSLDEAKQAKDIDYEELKKIQTGVFQEPETPTTATFKKYRIDVFDSNGKKIDEVNTVRELIIIEELG